MTIKPKLAAILLACLMLGSSMTAFAGGENPEQGINLGTLYDTKPRVISLEEQAASQAKKKAAKAAASQ